MLKKCASILLLAFLLVQTYAHAEIKLARPFGGNMVLQRDKSVPVWGQAEPGEKVTVIFGGQTKTATADKDGAWQIPLDPVEASMKGVDLVAKGANPADTVTLTNVVVGDVWLYIGGYGGMWGRQKRASKG